MTSDLSVIHGGRIAELTRVLDRTVTDFDGIQALLFGVVHSRRRILIAGNGGSHCDALHFAQELTGRYKTTLPPYPASALGTNPGHVSCTSNDFGAEHVFSREILAECVNDSEFARPGVVILLSTSGTSPNIREAIKVCADQSIPCILLTSIKCSLKSERSLLVVKVGSTSTDIIQEVHMSMLHSFVEYICMLWEVVHDA